MYAWIVVGERRANGALYAPRGRKGAKIRIGEISRERSDRGTKGIDARSSHIYVRRHGAETHSRDYATLVPILSPSLPPSRSHIMSASLHL